jgi:UDP-3-O-[3-hydroxymyristoyl] N-acetylglucosamine deacetylase
VVFVETKRERALAETPFEVTVEGVGLHTGAASRVMLRIAAGPVMLQAGGLGARIDELIVASTVRATTVEAHRGALRVGMVEHLFAALAGLGIRGGVSLSVEGPELPLLDGGAAAWCAALDRLRLAASRPRLRVVREAVTEVGSSRYEWSPRDGVEVEVRLELDGHDAGRLRPEARWGGDVADFRTRIATARTFSLVRDVDELLSAGLARHVDPESVVLLAPQAVYSAGRPFTSDEPARHKLLDLLGDMYFYGGPPLGRVRAVRPGHAANHTALARARAEGIVVFGR